MNEIRCKTCGRLLAKEQDNIVEILTSRKEKILIMDGKVSFVCATSVFTQKGRVKCGAMTKYERSEALSVSREANQVA